MLFRVREKYGDMLSRILERRMNSDTGLSHNPPTFPNNSGGNGQGQGQGGSGQGGAQAGNDGKGRWARPDEYYVLIMIVEIKASDNQLGVRIYGF